MKAQNRKNKLGSLQVGQVKAQIRIFKGSIMAAGLYGHQAMGVALNALNVPPCHGGTVGKAILGRDGCDIGYADQGRGPGLHYPYSAFLQFGQDCQKLGRQPIGPIFNKHGSRRGTLSA